jgi:ribosomal protein L29
LCAAGIRIRNNSKKYIDGLTNKKLTLKPRLIQIRFKNSVRTAEKTQLFTTTRNNRLMLFRETITV